MNGSIDYRADRPRPWRARYSTPGGGQRSRSFKTKREADVWRRTELSKQDRGTWVDPIAGMIQYSEFASEWIDGLVGIKEKTRRGYQGILDSRVVPAFGRHQLRQIDKASIREWVSTMERERLSPSRIRQCVQVVSASLKQASGDGIIGPNPAVGVRLPAAREREMLHLEAEQARLLAHIAERHQAGAGALITVLAWTGVRWGEAVALRRSSLKLQRHRMVINRSATELGGVLTYGTTKNHQSRTVVMPHSVSDLLRTHVFEMSPDDVIFTAPKGGPLRSANFRTRVWTPATTELAGHYPDLAGLRVHDLRHTAASLAISTGGNIKAVQRMLGHKRASLTLDRYGHLYEDDLELLAARLDIKFRSAA